MASRASPPPNPQGVPYEVWARKLYEYLNTVSQIESRVDPTAVLLANRVDSGRLLRIAGVDGILVQDSANKTPVVSIDNCWCPLLSYPEVSVSYEEATAVNGSALVIGANKVPFNVEDKNSSSWATFNVGTTDVTLKKGSYYLEGFAALTKISGTAKAFVGYLAKSSALTTEVGNVRLGSLVIPSTDVAGSTHVVPFNGFVNVPSEDNYSVVVDTPNSDTRFGTAHNITGFANTYGRLTITRVNLNE